MWLLRKLLSSLDTFKGGSFDESIHEDVKRALAKASSVLKAQVARLDEALNKLKEKDRLYYSKAVSLLRSGSRKEAIVYANELAEVRRVIRSVNYIRLAIEQVILRLSTINDLSEATTKIAPAIRILRSIRGFISGVIPQTEDELARLFEELMAVIVETSQSESLPEEMPIADEEAERILKEAERQAEAEVSSKLPPIPDIWEKEPKDMEEGLIA